MQLRDDYLAAYRSLKLTRDADGVLVVEFHSKGGPFMFTAQDHTESCGNRKPNLRPTPHKPRPHPIQTIPQLDAAAASRCRSSASPRNQPPRGEHFGQPRPPQPKSE